MIRHSARLWQGPVCTLKHGRVRFLGGSTSTQTTMPDSRGAGQRPAFPMLIAMPCKDLSDIIYSITRVSRCLCTLIQSPVLIQWWLPKRPFTEQLLSTRPWAKHCIPLGRGTTESQVIDNGELQKPQRLNNMALVPQ